MLPKPIPEVSPQIPENHILGDLWRGLCVVCKAPFQWLRHRWLYRVLFYTLLSPLGPLVILRDLGARQRGAKSLLLHRLPWCIASSAGGGMLTFFVIGIITTPHPSVPLFLSLFPWGAAFSFGLPGLLPDKRK